MTSLPNVGVRCEASSTKLELLAQAQRAMHAGVVHEADGEGLELLEGDLARLEAAREVEGGRRDGIERGLIGHLRAERLELLAQLYLVKLASSQSSA